jgi:hypothetical protein
MDPEEEPGEHVDAGIRASLQTSAMPPVYGSRLA